IRFLHPGLYPYDDEVLLHDLDSDPHQMINFADDKPDVVEELSGHMDSWRREQFEKGTKIDPLEEMVPLGPFIYYSPERMLQRLEKTGRGERIPELRSRLERYHPGRY
ncbi:MAG: hypothetical protein HXS50_05480, partial [Theionarchaea archaeon]|nr:hypothetical protein [Theionarchaea archaeon]